MRGANLLGALLASRGDPGGDEQGGVVGRRLINSQTSRPDYETLSPANAPTNSRLSNFNRVDISLAAPHGDLEVWRCWWARLVARFPHGYLSILPPFE